MFSHELFLEGSSRIHITSFKQLQEVKKYYEEEYELDALEHSVGVHNWHLYPYLYSDHGGIHGYSGSNIEYPATEYEEWAEYAGIASNEIEESEQDLNFLFA